MKVSRNTVVLGALVGLVIGAVGFVAWKQSGRTALPPGIVATNGRVESVARDDLRMVIPQATDLRIVRP